MRRAQSGVARRYARALLEVAGEARAAGLREELQAWAGLLRDTPDLQAALRHPALPAHRKRAVLQALGSATGASDILQRLLALLQDRDRLSLLPEISAAYVTLWNAQRGAVAAEVVSAIPLEDAQRDAVQAAVGRTSGRQVELHARVDPGLLGGLLLKMEGRTYDGSVRGRLRTLGERLRQGTATGGGTRH